MLEHALGASETMGFGVLQPLFLGYLAEAYVLAERLDDAREFAQRALTLARERDHRGYEAWTLRVLGEVTARGPTPEQADDHYRTALALGEELGMRPLIAHCHLGLGRLSRVTRDREQARGHLTTATSMYREMDMRFWLEQAEAELASG